jgi:hypothetical protein
MLKKEFSKKDVNRARNLIMGKTNTSTGTQVGYNKKEVDHKEGDVWIENKRTWTIKNGIKQTISKLDKIKKEVFVPLCCPKCNKVMKHHLDINSYKIHKNCHKCLIEFEHKLRNQGKYDEYKKNLINKNSLDIVNEMESYLLDAINTTNSGFISEDGVIERWVGGTDKRKLQEKVKTEFDIERKKLNDKKGA